MKDNERRISGYIDYLNVEKMPREHRNAVKDDEFQRLAKVVRRVRSLREPENPREQYLQLLKGTLQSSRSQATKPKRLRRYLILTAATVAAVALVFVTVSAFLPNHNTNIVYAMEKAVKAMKAYHGILEVTETNELGETMLQLKREVWADKGGNYYVKDLKGFSQGLVTANNGLIKWQIRPDEKLCCVYSAFPDSYRFTFEIGNEVNDVQKAQTIHEIGAEQINGRETMLLEVTPDGGEPYRLWVDQETDLPLKKQTAMQNGIQYEINYSFIEFIDAIPQELMSYSLPDGFREVNKDQEQLVATIEEAESKTGISVVITDNIPDGYTLIRITIDEAQPCVKLYYTTADKQNMVIVQQKKAVQDFVPAINALLGSVNNHQAEFVYEADTTSIRWQEDTCEFNLLGNTSHQELSIFAEGVSGGEVVIPIKAEATKQKPAIDVPVDLEAEENDQRSVDAGHSPWKLDPVFVAQVFASLLLSPEGITGDYPIPYEDIKMIENNGIEAKVRIDNEKSVAEYVYLKRLIRQDDTGIWTVIGYDPAKPNQ